MAKYLTNRLLRGIISIILVVAIVMILVIFIMIITVIMQKAEKKLVYQP